MWHKLKAAAEHPAVRLLKTLFGDPVQLYAVFLVMTAMYYYHEEWTWLYTAICAVLSWVVMRFYDFVAKHRFIGPVSYIIYMIAGLYIVRMITVLGEKNFPITFFVWFLTPQGVVDFSAAYTIAIYLLMFGFLTSTVYYFAKVRYRMSMQFLIMLIPLSLYAKEGRQMPALLVILLLSSFFLLMIYCRQLRDTQEVRQAGSFQSGVSIAVYVAAFSIAAAIIPKPAFQADREYIDNAMSYSTWSDVLMQAISMFTDSTDNRGAVSNNARTLFYVSAPESLRLRAQTFTTYQANDSWTVSDYDRPVGSYSDPLTYKPQDLVQAICDAAAADAAFAERYGLAEIAGKQLPTQPDAELLYYTWYNGRIMLAPTRGYTLENADTYQDLSVSPNRTLESSYVNRPVLMRYYPDTYARYQAVGEVLSLLAHDDYQDLLADAAEVLPEQADFLRQVSEEATAADIYLNEAVQGSMRSEVVEALAAELTEGLTSDMEKALAIERYFTEAGFEYDLTYDKPVGENVEDFLTTSHRGVCYEYATAMTLLCRSAGLPARYTQGYNMFERYNAELQLERYSGGIRGPRESVETNFLIKARNAHAFPEVYISGYGWLSFEPTVASDEEEDKAENLNVMRWGYAMLGLGVIVILIWLLLPHWREQSFRRRIRRMTAGECASAIFCRMRRSMKLPDSITVTELCEAAAAFCKDPALYAALDSLLYDPAAGTPQTAAALAESYEQWQASRSAYEKEQKRLQKAQKKQARSAK